MIFRLPLKNEKTQILRAFDRWGTFDYFKDKLLMIQVLQETRMVCLVSDVLQASVKILEPYHVGLVIGHLKKQFMPSLAGADLFARHARENNKFYIVVNEKAENLVLYGRDVMGDSIINASESLCQNELVILLNTKFEAIAIGRTRYSGKLLFEKGKVTISNITDAGYYLRKER
ncbi:MAG TPA: PUA domain-containing protein [Nitrososphaera sp.]